MSNIEFAWDKHKAEAILKQHGISFDEARTVFFDEKARHMPDPEHSQEEDRFVLLGVSAKLRLVVVCHCFREADTVIRIISARKATPKERKFYAEAL